MSSSLGSHRRKIFRALVIELVRTGWIRPLYNQWTISEYYETLSRRKFSLPDSAVKRTILAVTKMGIKCYPPSHSGLLTKDPDDQEFLEIFLSAPHGVERWLVTGDIDDYPKRKRIVRVRPFLDALGPRAIASLEGRGFDDVLWKYYERKD